MNIVHQFTDVIVPRIMATAYSGAVWSGDPSRRSIALTFDDGPIAGATNRILDLLDEAGVRGTFFILGSAVRRSPETAREISGRGHSVGFHGEWHIDPWRTTSSRLETDFRIGLSVITDVIGAGPIAYRPPYGHLRPTLSRLAAASGLPVVMWDMLVGDFRPGARHSDLAFRNRQHLRAGSIVVLHDSAMERAHYHLRSILAGASARGLSVEPLSTFLP